jgi:hypothetical protein
VIYVAGKWCVSSEVRTVLDQSRKFVANCLLYLLFIEQPWLEN